MSSSFTVDTAALSQHGMDVSSIARQIEDSMTLMRRKLESLQGSWKGSAAGQYTELHREWESAQEKVKTALMDISRAVASASKHYSTTESDVIATFRPA